MKLSKKVKTEVTSAIVMAILFLVFAVYVNQPRSEWEGGFLSMSSRTTILDSQLPKQQVVNEDIQGELKAGSFEAVVKSLRNLTDYYDGKMPYLTMLYENSLWHGSMNCKISTDNVTAFTFDVRQLISVHGKVKRISISVTEAATNQSGQTEPPVSTVAIGLTEISEGSSLIPSQIGAAVPWLITSLTLVAEGLIIIVPLSFICLGIVILVDRGIIPLWKRQLRSKSVSKVLS